MIFLGKCYGHMSWITSKKHFFFFMVLPKLSKAFEDSVIFAWDMGIWGYEMRSSSVTLKLSSML